jgi:type VI secretion system secreted protein VgrG
MHTAQQATKLIANSVQSIAMDGVQSSAQLQRAGALSQALCDGATSHRAQTSAKAHQAINQLAKTMTAKAVDAANAAPPSSSSPSFPNLPSSADVSFAQPVLVLESPHTIHAASPASTVVFAGGHSAWTTQGLAHWSAGQTVSSVSGRSSTLWSHAGGVEAIAANGPLSVQAHTGSLQVLAQEAITVLSIQGSISIEAKGAVVLQAGSSAVRLEGGNVTFTCPGTFTVKGASHPFSGGSSGAAELEGLPSQLIAPKTEDLDLAHSYHDGEGLKGAQYTAQLSNGQGHDCGRARRHHSRGDVQPGCLPL